MGGGIAGTLLGYKLQSDGFSTIVFDRRPFSGKKCTGVISRSTFSKLEVSKDFIDRDFKSIVIHHGKNRVFISTDVVRLNRAKLEVELSRELQVERVNATMMSDGVNAKGKKYVGEVVDCSGWKGKAKWVKAIEILIDKDLGEDIHVYLDERNPAGFSWVVPLPYGSLVGSISYRDPQLFLPNVEGRKIEVHGGGIPRPKPKNLKNKALGDVTGNIKTFTGGGIFGIATLLDPLLTYIKTGEKDIYVREYGKLSSEIEKQFRFTSFLERGWRLALMSTRLFNEKTINAREEFDFHSLLASLPH